MCHRVKNRCPLACRARTGSFPAASVTAPARPASGPKAHPLRRGSSTRLRGGVGRGGECLARTAGLGRERGCGTGAARTVCTRLPGAETEGAGGTAVRRPSGPSRPPELHPRAEESPCSGSEPPSRVSRPKPANGFPRRVDLPPAPRPRVRPLDFPVPRRTGPRVCSTPRGPFPAPAQPRLGPGPRGAARPQHPAPHSRPGLQGQVPSAPSSRPGPEAPFPGPRFPSTCTAAREAARGRSPDAPAERARELPAGSDPASPPPPPTHRREEPRACAGRASSARPGRRRRLCSLIRRLRAPGRPAPSPPLPAAHLGAP